MKTQHYGKHSANNGYSVSNIEYIKIIARVEQNAKSTEKNTANNSG
ncbi:hypothetical protein ACOI22_08435 [Glaciecola sp. 2405UD65-10]